MPAFLTNLIDWVQSLFDPVVDSGRPMIHVTSVVALPPHTLGLAFDNGDRGMVDLAQHIEFRGVLAPLQAPDFFRTVQLEQGTVCWPGGITMDPLSLHQLALTPPPPRKGASSSILPDAPSLRRRLRKPPTLKRPPERQRTRPTTDPK